MNIEIIQCVDRCSNQICGYNGVDRFSRFIAECFHKFQKRVYLCTRCLDFRAGTFVSVFMDWSLRVTCQGVSMADLKDSIAEEGIMLSCICIEKKMRRHTSACTAWLHCGHDCTSSWPYGKAHRPLEKIDMR